MTPVITGIIYYKNLSKEHKLFLYILIYSAVNEMFKQYYGTYIDVGQNRILSNIYNAVYFAFLFWLFHKKIESKNFKKVIKIIVLLYFLSICYEVFIIKINYHNKTQVIPYIIGGVGVIICVFQYLLNLINSKIITNLYRDLFFWIVIAHFIYYLAFTPFKISENYFMKDAEFLYLLNIKISTTLIKSILLSIGFIWNTHKKETFIILAIAILIILGCFTILLFVLFLKRKNQVIKNKDEAELNFKKELIETKIEIQMQTMKYIGREIHDNVGQKLTLSSLYLQQLVFENKAPQINKNINSINDIINESLNELRHLSKSLTDDTIENNSITELIENECEKIRELKKYTIVLESNLKITIDSYQTKSILLRTVQEFIQNSVKHSQCKKIKISLSNLEDKIQLILKDDGKGFNIKNLKSNGIGLKNMQKRIGMIKGSFNLESDPNGTILTVKIPI